MGANPKKVKLDSAISAENYTDWMNIEVIDKYLVIGRRNNSASEHKMEKQKRIYCTCIYI